MALNLNIIVVEELEHSQTLKTPAERVAFPLGSEEKKLITAMKSKLKKLGGIGLAATQVNVSKQIIAIYIPEEARLLRDNVASTYPMHVLINPSYTPLNQSQKADFEACYSVSTKAGKVPRYDEIAYSYYDEEGHYFNKVAQGFYARVLQHEIDHIKGILIVDRLTPECVQGTVEEMMLLRRAELPENKKLLFDAMMARKAKR